MLGLREDTFDRDAGIYSSSGRKLLSTLFLSKVFDIASTPLVTFRRIDLSSLQRGINFYPQVIPTREGFP